MLYLLSFEILLSSSCVKLICLVVAYVGLAIVIEENYNFLILASFWNTKLEKG